MPVFVAGIKRLNRVKGSGWLDCPNCHEHAAQDVIDDISFIAVLFYRLAPYSRRRYLLCRRCEYRRAAIPEEMKHLNTAGRSIRRTAMIPVGILAVLLVASAGALALGGSGTLAQNQIKFVDVSAGKVAPFEYAAPSAWNQAVYADSTPPYVRTSDQGDSGLAITLRRITDSATLTDLVLQHYADEKGLSAEGFPGVPPKGTCTMVAGQPATRLVIDFSVFQQRSRLTMYALFHQGAGYTLSFTATGDDGIKLMTAIAERVISSAKFVGPEESPSAAAASPPAPATPAETPLATSAASPSPEFAVNC